MSGTPDTSRITGDIVLLDGLYYKDISINPLGIVEESVNAGETASCGIFRSIYQKYAL